MLGSLTLWKSVYKWHWSPQSALDIISCVPCQHQETEPILFFLSESEEVHKCHLACQGFLHHKMFQIGTLNLHSLNKIKTQLAVNIFSIIYSLHSTIQKSSVILTKLGSLKRDIKKHSFYLQMWNKIVTKS